MNLLELSWFLSLFTSIYSFIAEIFYFKRFFIKSDSFDFFVLAKWFFVACIFQWRLEFVYLPFLDFFLFLLLLFFLDLLYIEPQKNYYDTCCVLVSPQISLMQNFASTFICQIMNCKFQTVFHCFMQNYWTDEILFHKFFEPRRCNQNKLNILSLNKTYFWLTDQSNLPINLLRIQW